MFIFNIHELSNVQLLLTRVPITHMVIQIMDEPYNTNFKTI